MQTAHDTKHDKPKMNLWTNIKRRFTAKNAKVVKKKAMAGAELVAAGAALTGGSMLLKEMVKPK